MEKVVNTIDINRNVKVVVLEQKEVTPRPDLVGQWLDERHYHTLVQSDMDLYLPPKCASELGSEDCGKDCANCADGLDEHNIVFKFRKNYFSPEMTKSAYEGLRDAAQETQNRGTAAGPREGTLGNREWVTAYQWAILDQIKNGLGPDTLLCNLIGSRSAALMGSLNNLSGILARVNDFNIKNMIQGEIDKLKAKIESELQNALSPVILKINDINEAIGKIQDATNMISSILDGSLNLTC